MIVFKQSISHYPLHFPKKEKNCFEVIKQIISCAYFKLFSFSWGRQGLREQRDVRRKKIGGEMGEKAGGGGGKKGDFDEDLIQMLTVET